jgi:peptide/nickel transport system substrate-binding protein
MPTGEPAGLPSEAPKGTPWGKIAAVVIVLIVIIAAIVVWQLGQGARETQPAITRVEITSGTTGSVGSVGIAIGFRATATGTIGSYDWDFGDGQKTSGLAVNTTTHSYATDGTYIVLVTVKSPGGLTATNDNTLLNVIVLDSAFQPTDTSARAVSSVNPSATQLSGGTATITANGSASHGFINCPVCEPDTSLVTGYSWNWSDATALGTSADMTHNYNAVGNYAVKLTVTVTGGATDSEIHTVRVAPAPVTLVKNPGVLVIASIGDPQYLDPAIDYETAGGEILKNVYDRLVTRAVDVTDPANPTINNAQFVGAAASSWTVSTNQMTWNFTIRPGLHWQDTTYGDLDAYDAEYSLRRVMMINIGPTWIIDQYLTGYASDDPLTGANERWDAINASVVATDAMHLELRLARPYGAVLQTLDFEVGSIVSKDWVLAHGGTQLNAQNAYLNQHTMGTGPYVLDHWTPGVEIKLVKNAAYWGPIKPKLAAILYKLVPEPATQELLLKNGDVDWADGIPTSDIRTVMTWQGVVVKENPSLVVQYMGMVEDNSWVGDPLRTINTSPFQDVHVRRAVSYAFDYQFVQQQVLSGFATQLKSGVPQGMPGWDGSFWNYQTNAASAQAELAQASNPAWRGGFDTTLSYNSGNPVRAQVSTMVQAQLKTILNINVTIQAVSFPAHLDNMDFRRVGMYLIGWAPDFLDPDDYLTPLFHGAACPQPVPGDPLTSDAGTNSGCYRNPIVDSALDNATATAVWQYRLENYTVAQQHIVQEAAWVFNYQPEALDPIRTWLRGYYFDPMELRDFITLYK